MLLDYASLLIALGFAGVCLAVTLFVAWFSSRAEGFLLSWSLGVVLIVVHVIVYGFYVTEPQPGVEVTAFAALILGMTLVYTAAVQVRRGTVSVRRKVAVAAVALVVGLAGFFTPYNGLGFIATNAVTAALLFASAWQYARVRDEAPGVAVGLVLLYVAMGASFLLCAVVLAFEGVWVVAEAPENWAEALNIAMAIACLPGVGALSLALNQARIARSHRRAAETDVLTGLLNRRALFERFDGHDLPPFTSVMVFDVDLFKEVNDRYGHAVGDEVLRRFAATLRAGVRNIDTVARVGGEEFVVVLPRSEADAAVPVAERIRRAFAAVVVETDAEALQCTVSAGVAATAAEPQPFAAVLRRADDALYTAKRGGRDRVVAEPLRLVG